MATNKLSQWLGEKAKDLRNSLERLLDAASDNNSLQPIPIRVEDSPRRSRNQRPR